MSFVVNIESSRKKEEIIISIEKNYILVRSFF